MIEQVRMSTHYAPPRRRRAPQLDDYDGELQYARRVAEVMVGVLRSSGSNASH